MPVGSTDRHRPASATEMKEAANRGGPKRYNTAGAEYDRSAVLVFPRPGPEIPSRLRFAPRMPRSLT